jgi:hypothetical protein
MTTYQPLTWREEAAQRIERGPTATKEQLNTSAIVRIVWTDDETTDFHPHYNETTQQAVERYCKANKRNIHDVEDFWTED